MHPRTHMYALGIIHPFTCWAGELVRAIEYMDYLWKGNDREQDEPSLSSSSQTIFC
jgi:hypothetical protein